MRRIAIEKNGEDETGYQRDMWTENIASLAREDKGRRNVVELAEFAVRLRTLSDEELVSTCPDLTSRYFDQQKAIDMYRRFADEALSVLSSKASIAAIL